MLGGAMARGSPDPLVPVVPTSHRQIAPQAAKIGESVAITLLVGIPQNELQGRGVVLMDSDRGTVTGSESPAGDGSRWEPGVR